MPKGFCGLRSLAPAGNEGHAERTSMEMDGIRLWVDAWSVGDEEVPRYIARVPEYVST